MRSSASLHSKLTFRSISQFRLSFTERNHKVGRLVGQAAFLIVTILCTDLAICSAQGSQDNQVLATVNGKPIYQSEVDASIAIQLMPLQQQIYVLRKSALDSLVIAALLESEAKKQGISVLELKKLWTAQPVQVSTNAVEDLYRESASAFGAMSPDEAKERLRLDLESQARMRNYRAGLSSLRSAARIDLFLDEPRLAGVTDGRSPFLGSKEATVTIFEFSDFQCPYCRQAQDPIKQILTAYKDDVRLVFKHLPLDIHPQAFTSAQAAFCAGEQDLFWPFHDALFALEDLSLPATKKTATELGLNMEEFSICLVSDSSRTAILKDLQEAKRLGIVSTPTFIINGRLFSGAIGFEAFREIIDRELRSVRSGNKRQSRPTSNLREK